MTSGSLSFSARCGVAFLLLTQSLQDSRAAEPDVAPISPGAVVHFQLPMDGPLPRTYLVTLAITDPKDPHWVISNFTSGAVRTVTVENQGRFAETWDGLDENYMPVPPGTYGVKGIFMSATKWPIDGQYHAIIPKLAAAAGSWGQSPGEDSLPDKIEGDPVGAPLGDVDVAENGKGVLAFTYLENGKNYFLTDFTKPVGYGEIITGYDSGVFAGATSVCTDGQFSWCFSTDGGRPFIARADGQPFGHQKTGRDHVYLPEGWVKGLSAWADKDRGRTVIFDAEAGKIVKPASGDEVESSQVRTDEVRALDSQGAEILARWKIGRPLALAARQDRLYLLHQAGEGFEVLSISLEPGWEKVQPTLLFKVPVGVRPFDLEADSHGRIYLSDSNANHVYQFDSHGKQIRIFGRLKEQAPGHYDKETFMAPEKLACWTDGTGQDRLLVLEQGGPNRLSEWSCDSGSLLRQWVVPQTHANDGYAVDPHHPDLIYLQGQRNSIVRWKINYATGDWTPNAVWNHIGPSVFDGKLTQDLAYPRMVYRGSEAYLVFWRGYAVYHVEGNNLRACAAVLADRTDPDHPAYYLWSDTNGDGRVQPDEYLTHQTTPPPGIFRYFGETWFDDLSLVCIGGDTTDIWRLPPARFDDRGTPFYNSTGWQKLLTDDIFASIQEGHATSLRGGNEAATSFNSAWASVVKATGGDVYVSARSGRDFSANSGAQYKLSRYEPDGKGGFHQRWRVGRMALDSIAKTGQVYGPIYVSPPMNGIIGVVDNSRAGMVLYNQDGLYIDTIFPDVQVVPHDQMGAYWQPGEFFAGYNYPDRDNGKIYFALGKAMPQLFEAKGWSMTGSPVRALATTDSDVTLSADEIASPPSAALQLRGGLAASHVAQFDPAPGTPPALDGTLQGWESCSPIQFGNGPKQTVEVRCLYDREHLYLRWHAQLGRAVKIGPLGLPEHIFAHGQENDTFGLYLQGDPHAAPGGSIPNGRNGDVRLIFGLFKNDGLTRPVVVGMYPSWTGRGAASRTYRTPEGGSATFANVGLVAGVKTGYQLDPDGDGFVLAASIPRAALPYSPSLDGWRTEGNFDANLGGHDRFWWSNADGSASRETFDEPSEARFYPGSWSMVQCLPMTSLPIKSWMAIGPFGSPAIGQLDPNRDRDQIIQILFGASFPPDTIRDTTASYDGPSTHTRAAQRRVAWQKVVTRGDTVDFQKAIGWDGSTDEGTAYLLTHIYSPLAANIRLQVTQPEGQYAVHGQLNGKPLPVVKEDGQPWIHLDASRPLHLQAGWNELIVRRDFIWGAMTLGASLQADPSILWQLRIQGPAP